MISVIIVNYNVKKHLSECIDSLYKFNNVQHFEIIILDNNSNEKVDDVIKDRKNIRLHSFENNIGFSKAVNYGIKMSKGSKILLLNPDTIIITDILNIMSLYLEENVDVGVVGAKVMSPDGKYQLSSKRSFPYIYMAFVRFFYLDKLFYRSRFFGRYNYSFINNDIAMEVDSVSGACMMFRKKITDYIDDFDENFFLYFEDTDFCYRVKKHNYKVVYNPDAKIIHKKRQSFYNSDYSVNYEFFKSLYAFYIKHYDEYKNSKLLKVLVKVNLRILIFILDLVHKLVKKIK